MVSRSCRTERGVTLVEALVGVIAGTMLLGIAFGVMKAGSRIQARAESKLAATGEAELVFRKLGRDLSAAVKPPRVEGNEVEIATTSSPSVIWTFAAGGKGSGVERRDGTECARHLTGTLVAAELKQVSADGLSSVALAMTARGTHDVASADFRETFFLRSVRRDTEWNALR